MKFIRDIISEKRALKPESTVKVPEARTLRSFEQTAVSEGSNGSQNTRPAPFVLSKEQAIAPHLNIFATEDKIDHGTRQTEDDAADELNFGSDLPGDDQFNRNNPTRPLLALEGRQQNPDADDAGEPSGQPETNEIARTDEPDRQIAPAQMTPIDRPETWGVQRKDAEENKANEQHARELSGEARPRLALNGSGMAEMPLSGSAFAAAGTHPAVVEQVKQHGLSEMPFVSARQPDQPDEMINDAGIQVPPPAAGRGANRSGRVKTRLLGFNPENVGVADPFKKEQSSKGDSFPVGWIVVVAGPGRGASFALHDGVSKIGRGDDQTVPLNFGDNSISRENHVAIAYDVEQNAFFIGQSGRANIVRLNNKPLLSTEQLRSGDQIRVGETTLRLAALCSEGFSWAEKA